MDESTLKRRTKKAALDVVKLVSQFPRNITADVLGRQLIRSATSVGSNYRAACRGKSVADMIAKLQIVEEEADETCYWMELCIEGGITDAQTSAVLLKEFNEFTAIAVASVKTLRARMTKGKTREKAFEN